MKHADLNPLFSDAASLGRSTILFHEDGLRGLLLHLKAGERIPEHQARGAISVHCLKGEAAFSCGDVQVTLRPASLVSLPAAHAHGVAAIQDTLLLVTIREQMRDEPA